MTGSPDPSVLTDNSHSKQSNFQFNVAAPEFVPKYIEGNLNKEVKLTWNQVARKQHMKPVVASYDKEDTKCGADCELIKKDKLHKKLVEKVKSGESETKIIKNEREAKFRSEEGINTKQNVKYDKQKGNEDDSVTKKKTNNSLKKNHFNKKINENLQKDIPVNNDSNHRKNYSGKKINSESATSKLTEVSKFSDCVKATKADKILYPQRSSDIDNSLKSVADLDFRKLDELKKINEPTKELKPQEILEFTNVGTQVSPSSQTIELADNSKSLANNISNLNNNLKGKSQSSWAQRIKLKGTSLLVEPPNDIPQIVVTETIEKQDIMKEKNNNQGVDIINEKNEREKQATSLEQDTNETRKVQLHTKKMNQTKETKIVISNIYTFDQILSLYDISGLLTDDEMAKLPRWLYDTTSDIHDSNVKKSIDSLYNLVAANDKDQEDGLNKLKHRSNLYKKTNDEKIDSTWSRGNVLQQKKSNKKFDKNSGNEFNGSNFSPANVSSMINLPENCWQIQQEQEKKTNKNLAIRIRKFRSQLNKIAPTTCEDIYKSILELGIESLEEAREFVKLIFDKAITNHKYIELYADMCSRLRLSWAKVPIFCNSDNISFKKLLVSQCEQTFTKFHENPFVSDPNMTEEEQFEALLEHKRKMKGNLMFISILAQTKVINIKILINIIRESIVMRKPLQLESLAAFLPQCYLAVRDNKYSDSFDQILNEIQEVVDSPDLELRVRFLLEDALDNIRTKKANFDSLEKYEKRNFEYGFN